MIEIYGKIQERCDAGIRSIFMVDTPKAGKKLSWILIGFAIFLFLFSFLPWTQNVSGKGQVTAFHPENRPQSLQSNIPGRMDQWFVQEGQYVSKGDTLLKLTEIKEEYLDPNLLVRQQEQLSAKSQGLVSIQDKTVSLEDQLSALRTSRELAMQQAENKLQQAQLKQVSDSLAWEAAKIDFQVAKEQFARQQKLYDQGLKSLTELESRKLKFQQMQAKLMEVQNKFLTSKNEVINSRLYVNSADADYRSKIAKIRSEIDANKSYGFETEAEIAKMENKLSGLKVRSGYYYITAPQSGYVVKALKTGLGETIKEGESLATIMPQINDVAVELYVRTVDLPLLYKGAPVRLQFDGWPAVIFSGWPGVSMGTFGGRIQVIDLVNASEGKYRILVTPDPEEEHWPDEIRIGSGAKGWALLNDVPIWYEIWRNLNAFPADKADDDSDPMKKLKLKVK